MCISAGFLLLFIYAMINMNIVSWGTREVPNADDVDVDIANRVKQPNAWVTFIQEVGVPRDFYPPKEPGSFLIRIISEITCAK